MNGRKSFFASAGIATRLLLWFLAISLVPCVLLAVVTTYLARASLELSVRERLMLISDAKTTQLESFVRERRGDALILGNAFGVIQAVTEMTQVLEKEKA